ncbi:MAG: thioredoxin domain-containing protein [Blastocatellia bacterium]|nr:thioredoxin domain-containing protein [Blastocatellia bacterium]
MNRLALNLFLILIACAMSAQAQSGTAKSEQAAGEKQSFASNASTTRPTDEKGVEKKDDCGCDAGALPDVLAIAGGVKITGKDVDKPIEEKIADLHRQVVEMRKRELYLQINSKLLSTEAKKRGVSATRLLEEEVTSKVKEPAQAEAQAYYDQNRARISAEFEDVKDLIIQYLRDQRQGEEAKKFAEALRASNELKVLVETATPPETHADRERVFATIGKQAITSGDVEDALRPVIFNVQEQIYDLRRRELDQRINEVVFQQEAQKRQITTRALLDVEAASKIRKVTDTDARAFYDQNRDRVAGEYAQLKDQIIEYLQDVERQRAEQEFAGQLRRAASIQVFLAPPEPPVYAIAIDDQPSKGEASAPVTIVEFTDFECPSCARAQPIIEKLAGEYGDRVKIVVRDFPLQSHRNALKAAEAAEAARAQGKYWEYIALLFEKQSELGIEKLKEYASRLGLDRKRFDQSLDTGEFFDKVKRDVEDGLKLGVNSTPTIFVNGRLVRDNAFENLKAAIEAALKN